jgi:S1-C subfamily serine protease
MFSHRIVHHFKTCGILFLLLLLGLPWFMFTDAAAERVYIWRDKQGNVHRSQQRPLSDQVDGKIEIRELKDFPPPEKKEPPPSRTPLEHAINSTFRLRNKRGGASAFFVNDNGVAITAKHVVKGISYSMKAELVGDDKKYHIRVLKRSRKHDLALIKVSVDRTTPYLTLRDPKTLVRGEIVYSIGNPLLAFKETITSGNFSRIFTEKDFKKELKRKPPYRGDWIQFSAPIIGGNSGGPVIDKEGKVIGVVSLGLRAYGAINFAVPSSYILKEFKSYLE